MFPARGPAMQAWRAGASAMGVQPRPGQPDTTFFHQDPAMNPMTFPKLSDKVILIYLKARPPDDNVLLSDARFETQGGKVFLVGEVAEGGSANDWVAGIQTAIGWDCVEQYFIFDTMTDYLNRVSRAYSTESIH